MHIYTRVLHACGRESVPSVYFLPNTLNGIPPPLPRILHNGAITEVGLNARVEMPNSPEILHENFAWGCQIPCLVGDTKNTEGVPKSLGNLTRRVPDPGLFSLPVRKNSHGTRLRCTLISHIDGKFHSSFFAALHTDHLENTSCNSPSTVQLPEMHTFSVIQYRVWHWYHAYLLSLASMCCILSECRNSGKVAVQLEWALAVSMDNIVRVLYYPCSKSLARVLTRPHARNQMVGTLVW